MAEVASPTWVDSIEAKRPIIGQDMGVPQQLFNKVLRDRVSERPDHIQYVSAEGEEYTLKKFYDLSMRVARSIVSFGLLPLEGVSIHGFNSIPWFAIDVGSTLASCLSSGIYTTNKPEVCAYIINHSKSRLVFVDSQPALEKILSIRADCPKLDQIIIWGDYDASAFEDNADLIMTWDAFLARGDASNVKDEDLLQREEELSPESVCKLIYTSGTTGPPKAVMISHDNYCFIGIHFDKTSQTTTEDRVISFLPLSHIAANTVDICGAIINGHRVYLADSNALKGSLSDTLKKVRPTVFLSIPRVFEKMQEAMARAGANSSPVKKFIASVAKGVGAQASAVKDAGGSNLPWGYGICKKLVFDKVREALGLDQCRIIINASAPMQKATDAYFKSLDVRILDLYGMSEATGPISVNYPDYKAGTSGKIINGIDTKIINEIAPGEGELCFRGRNMFMGYLADPEESAKSIDEEGYVHSGDIGKIDEDGFLVITGRVKDLLITSGGENVAPTLVESTLISAMPAISRAFAIGDQRKFISVLMIPAVDEKGTLVGPAAAVNPNITTGEEAVKDEVWKKYLEEGVKKANVEAISNASKVKQYRLLGMDFSVEGGELTPTMKVKRKIVLEKYSDTVESMYN